MELKQGTRRQEEGLKLVVVVNFLQDSFYIPQHFSVAEWSLHDQGHVKV